MTVAYSRGAKFKDMGQVSCPNSGLAVGSEQRLVGSAEASTCNKHSLSGVQCMKDATFAGFGDVAPIWRFLNCFGDRKMSFGNWR